MCTRLVIILLISVQLSAADDQTCKNGAMCMVVESCNDIYNSLRQFERTYLLKLLQRLHCGYDENDKPKICCPPNFEVPRDSFRFGQLSKSEALDLLPNKTVCGLQITDKIVGGMQTNLDEHPWMAIIYCVTPEKTNVCCGGALISSRYVMTAAHCVKTIPDVTTTYKVRLGEWRLSSDADCVDDECSPDPIDVDVEEVLIHENHRAIGQKNDIALLRLARNVPFNEFIKPICLPVDKKLEKNTFETYVMEVAGWGVTGDDLTSDFKLKVRLPVTSLQQCQLIYKNYNINENQICAGGLRGQDSCRGDSGGPLMGQIDAEENWMAIGVVSFGSLPCGRPGWPGVYTRVTSYIDWILSKLRP